MIQKAGYQQRQRLSGSDWFLCDYCETIAFVTSDEEKMKAHVKKEHDIPKDSLK